jgi:hypothetical protein
MEMEDFYEGGLIYDCFDDEDDAHAFIDDHKDENLSKCFVVIFDPTVSKGQMIEEIIEAVKCSFREEEENE